MDRAASFCWRLPEGLWAAHHLSGMPLLTWNIQFHPTGSGMSPGLGDHRRTKSGQTWDLRPARVGAVGRQDGGSGSVLMGGGRATATGCDGQARLCYPEGAAAARMRRPSRAEPARSPGGPGALLVRR